MEVKIRTANPDDVPGILAIVNHAILHTTAIYDYQARTLVQQQLWFEQKQVEGFPIIVAEVDGRVAGFGTYGTFRVKQAYQFTVEHSVYVAQGFQGKGIGSALLQELISFASQSGFHTMIGCIDADNAGSIAFHGKFGFQAAGTLKAVGFKFDRWLDLVLMQLILA